MEETQAVWVFILHKVFSPHRYLRDFLPTLSVFFNGYDHRFHPRFFLQILLHSSYNITLIFLHDKLHDAHRNKCQVSKTGQEPGQIILLRQILDSSQTGKEVAESSWMSEATRRESKGIT